MKDKTKEIGKLYTKSLKKGMDEVTIEMQQNRIKELEQELNKYKNIVNELEKYLENNKVNIGIKSYSKYAIPVEDILNKLKELKGSDS